jgi:hypothetical protein
MSEEVSVGQLLEFMAMPELASHFQSEYQISLQHHDACYCCGSRSARYGLMVEHFYANVFLSLAFTRIVPLFSCQLWNGRG